MSNLCKIALAAFVMTALARPAAAQEFLYVTGVSQPGGAVLTQADRDAVALRSSSAVGATFRFERGNVRVAPGAELMLLSESGVALVAFGGSEFALGETDDGGALVTLGRGAMLIVAPRELNFEPAPRFEANPGAAVEFFPAPGRTFLAVEESAVRVGFISDVVDGETLTLQAKNETLDGEFSFGGGRQLLIGPRASEPAEWSGNLPTDLSAARLGQELGVAGATEAVAEVQSVLFDNIIAWDQFAEKDYVTARIVAGRFSPEIRQVTTSVSQPLRRTAPPAAVPDPINVQAANEVPPLSPAALSVVNIQAGVTAIELNAQARGLLSSTGSRGLGFGGLRQLAIPGFLRPGVRTIGPAGLGATD